MRGVWLSLALVTLASCSSLGAVRFDGHAREPLTTAGQVGDVSALPTGYDALGEIAAHCNYYEGQRPPDGAPLSDVDCSEARLTRAIREGAAEAGGELLVGRRCRSTVVHEDEDSLRMSVSCTATVARPDEDTLAERGLVAPRGTRDELSAREAWHIRVRFTDSGKVLRSPRKVDYVREVGDMPVSNVRIGDVITECDDTCNRAAVRHGLLVAAGRFGATDVVGVRCAERNSGYFCTGTATAYEIDPTLDPAAR